MKKHNKNYAALENAALTERQKEKMLEHILAEYRKYSRPAEKFLKLVAAYPGVLPCFSTLQAALCTAIWDGYTNMVLRIFGGLK